MVARHTARLLVAVARKGISVRIHAILDALGACVTEAVIVRNGLEHVEPHGSLLALEVPRLELDSV